MPKRDGSVAINKAVTIHRSDFALVGEKTLLAADTSGKKKNNNKRLRYNILAILACGSLRQQETSEPARTNGVSQQTE